MTIDEAIKHCEVVAEEQEKLCKFTDAFNFSQLKWRKCAAEHRQLAEWLRELKSFKEKDEAKAVRYENGAIVYDMAFCPNCGQRLRWKE